MGAFRAQVDNLSCTAPPSAIPVSVMPSTLQIAILAVGTPDDPECPLTATCGRPSERRPLTLGDVVLPGGGQQCPSVGLSGLGHDLFSRPFLDDPSAVQH